MKHATTCYDSSAACASSSSASILLPTHLFLHGFALRLSGRKRWIWYNSAVHHLSLHSRELLRHNHLLCIFDVQSHSMRNLRSRKGHLFSQRPYTTRYEHVLLFLIYDCPMGIRPFIFVLSCTSLGFDKYRDSTLSTDRTPVLPHFAAGTIITSPRLEYMHNIVIVS